MSPDQSTTNDNKNESDGNSIDNIDPSLEPQLPIEYQLDEVDLTDPNMDPLEYTFRKYVPIPKAYFWDTASETNDYNQNLPLRTKIWHHSIYYSGVVLRVAEAVGESVANILGLKSHRLIMSRVP